MADFWGNRYFNGKYFAEKYFGAADGSGIIIGQMAASLQGQSSVAADIEFIEEVSTGGGRRRKRYSESAAIDRPRYERVDPVFAFAVIKAGSTLTAGLSAVASGSSALKSTSALSALPSATGHLSADIESSGDLEIYSPGVKARMRVTAEDIALILALAA